MKKHIFVQVNEAPKLRTYRRFKESHQTEYYLKCIANRGHRAVLSQFRCGILPLAIETGRFMNIPLEYRLCNFCEDNIML